MSYQIIRLREVVSKTGLSRSTIYSRIADGSFPRPIPLGARAVGFISDEVDMYLEKLITDARDNTDTLEVTK